MNPQLRRGPTKTKKAAYTRSTTIVGVYRSALPDEDEDGTSGLDSASGKPIRIRATYGDLVHLLGNPNGRSSEQTTSAWVLRKDGGAFTVYDYKATSKYDPEDLPSVTEFRKKPYDWHVGTDGSDGAAQGAALVKKAVAKLR